MAYKRVSLTARSSVAEVEAELTRRGVPLQPSVSGEPYAVDWHFREYAYGDIESCVDALRLCDELDQECGGLCQKARSIRNWLADPTWTDSASSIRLAIAANRRICCSQHEMGSMCLTH